VNVRKFAGFACITGLFALGVVWAGVVLAQASTGSTDQTVHVNISDTALLITPPRPNLGLNTPFSLTVHNSGTFTYSLVLEKPGAVNRPLAVNGASARVDNITPGADIIQTWMIPAPGTYQFAAYTSPNATTPSALTAILVVSSTITPGATSTVAATSVATRTVTAALPQTGGPDDSLPLGLVLIICGTLFVVGSLLASRKLARRSDRRIS
jgi:hypothetical protein